jgi:hypothetical protein
MQVKNPAHYQRRRKGNEQHQLISVAFLKCLAQELPVVRRAKKGTGSLLLILPLVLVLSLVFCLGSCLGGLALVAVNDISTSTSARLGTAASNAGEEPSALSTTQQKKEKKEEKATNSTNRYRQPF